MDRKTSKLEQEQRSELESQQQTQPSPLGKVFETVEELLRHDANQTHPPDQLRERLAESIKDAPPQVRSWWRRLFGMG